VSYNVNGLPGIHLLADRLLVFASPKNQQTQYGALQLVLFCDRADLIGLLRM
jgi:hypothetical protein